MKKFKLIECVFLATAGAWCLCLGAQGAQASSANAAKQARLADANDASNPQMVAVQPPQWLIHDNSAIERPRDAPQAMDDQQQMACSMKILKYINDKFHTHFTSDNIAPVQLPAWKSATRGFVRGGGFNIRIVGYQTFPVDPETGARQRPVKPSRYMPWAGYAELGIHPSLHIPGSINGYQTYTRRQVGDSEYLLDFVAHIDSANPWVPPFGSLMHLFRDVIGSSSRNPCPGSE